MIFGKPEQKKPAEAGTPMPSAATLLPTAAAPAPAAVAAPTPVPSTPVPSAAPPPGSAPAAGGSSAAPRERQTATIRPRVRRADATHRVQRDARRRSQARRAHLRPSLSGEPHRAVAGSGDRAHQPYAADRSGPYPGWRGQDGAGARPEAAIELTRRYGYGSPPRGHDPPQLPLLDRRRTRNRPRAARHRPRCAAALRGER